ncbi:MAG TPA: HAMP domain-containing sensor histidine kinase [Polyangia bacterium]
MPCAESGLAERVLEHIAEIGTGRCSITDASIAAERDASAQEILAGLLMLHEDLRYAQERQSVLLDDLREAVRARDEFLSIASHELRTPITTLTLQIDGLLRALRDPAAGAPADKDLARDKMTRRLEVTRRQVDRLTALVAALIDVSRITAGRVELAKQTADLVAVVRSVVERFTEEAQRSGSSLRLQESTPIWGHFDVSRIDQVITNLLANAIRYGRGKPIVVGTGSDSQTARFWVEDGGIGIPPEHQARIFQRYERAAPSTSYGGLGLGLWISRRLTEAMGGAISVRSEAGVGSVFTVEIPRGS